MPAVSVVHFALACASVVGITALLVASLATATGWLRTRLWLDRSILAQTGTALAAAVIGLVMLVAGSRPPDALHLVYGVVLVVGPLAARYVVRNVATRRTGGAMAIVAIVLAGVVVRSFMTGS